MEYHYKDDVLLNEKISEIIALRNELLKKAKRNKKALYLLALLANIYLIPQTLYFSIKYDLSIYLIACSVLFISLLGVLISLKKDLITKKDQRLFKSQIKNNLYRYIISNLYPNALYSPIYRRSFNYYNKSKIFDKQITESAEDDCIEFGDETITITASECLLLNGIKQIFHGYFVCLKISDPRVFSIDFTNNLNFKEIISHSLRNI